MKKMNKILSVMMAAAMTVSMTACGGDTASDNPPASADNSAAATESAAAGSGAVASQSPYMTYIHQVI